MGVMGISGVVNGSHISCLFWSGFSLLKKERSGVTDDSCIIANVVVCTV